jgi:glycosyltransferase involved in cell wall biosynthesis
MPEPAAESQSETGQPDLVADTLRFSVVMPAYNEAAFIGESLRSLLQQDFAGRYEIIVVNNNSTDATGEIAESFGVRVVSEPEPGVCFARQRGTAAARGQIVLSTDADTIYPRNWLSRIDAAFRRSPNVVGVGGPCRYRNPAWWVDMFPRVLFGLVYVVYRMTGWVGYVTATNTAFLRTAFSGYDLTMTQGGDELDVVRRLRQRGRVVWDQANMVETSPRRQEQGIFYTFFVSFVYYYLIAYWLNRIAGSTVLGMAPSFRTERKWNRRLGVRVGVGVTVAVLLTTSVGVVRYLVGR